MRIDAYRVSGRVKTGVDGRWYSVLHEGSLTNSLANLVVGIDFPQNIYTDTMHGAESEGFYRVEVELK